MRPFSALFLLPPATAMMMVAATAAPGTELLGSTLPASDAVLAPEATILHSVSDDGRWLLVTSANDRWVTNDLNAAADVFLVDLTTGALSLMSSSLGGQSGQGTSRAGGLSADANRVVYQTRAPFGVWDRNLSWDVFVHDALAQTNLPISVDSTGHLLPTGSATEPWISEDGRYVLFCSTARLAPRGFLTADNVYRRDLVAGRTDCVTTNLPNTPGGFWRMTAFATTPDVQAVVVHAADIYSSAGSNVMAWFDLTTGRSEDCTAALPAELVGSWLPRHSLPAVSANRRFVAFRSELRVPVANLRLYGLSVFDTELMATTLLSLRTNDSSLQAFAATAYQAEFSADGRFVAYAAPWPYNPTQPAGPSRTNGLLQVYLHDRQDGTTRLVSAAPDGFTPADAGAREPRIAADGRGVMFLSRATNLAADTSTAMQRVYWWDQTTATLRVAGEPGGDVADGRAVLSPGGDWVASLNLEEEGNAAITLFHTSDFSARSVAIRPIVLESRSGRGWFLVRPEGVSADGRYVTVSAVPPATQGVSNYLQAYRLDTETGARQLLTDGVDGQLATSPPLAPSLSADGTRALYASAATNLSAEDLYPGRDAFLFEGAGLPRRLLRPADLPPGTEHTEWPPLLSPDGRFALLTYRAGSQMQLRLADLQTGTYGVNLRPDLTGSSWLLGTPSFSRDGRRLALRLGSASTGAVELYDPLTWMSTVEGPVPCLWRSAAGAPDPSLSVDGGRVAYVLGRTNPVSYAVVVTDWAQGQDLYNRSVGSQAPSALKLSADGAFIVWDSVVVGAGSTVQIWCGEVASRMGWVMSVGASEWTRGNANSKSPVISADGRFVAFASLADNLVPGDTNRAQDVFLRDRQIGRTLMVSRGLTGAPSTGWSLQPFFSAEGRDLFFLSHAPDLAAGDYNQTVDLFKVEIAAITDLFLVIRRNLTSGDMELLWSAERQRQYAIEFKDALEAADWTRLPGTFDGNEPVKIDPGVASQRFYRLVALP